MSFKVSRFGRLPDLPDHRDHLYAVPVEVASAVPASVDLCAQCPPVYDQWHLGSCSDSGAQIRDGIKCVGRQGDSQEAEWPYVIAKFKTRPPKKCYADALKYKAVLYQCLTPVLSQLKDCLASGWPFVFGFTVYESFESARVAKTGYASLPKSSEQPVGGHAVMCAGYDNAKQWFVVQNSWRPKSGMKGDFTPPCSYLISANLASVLLDSPRRSMIKSIQPKKL